MAEGRGGRFGENPQNLPDEGTAPPWMTTKLPGGLGECGGHRALLLALLQHQRGQVQSTFHPSGRMHLQTMRASSTHEDRVLARPAVPHVLQLGMGEGGTLGKTRIGPGG